MDATCKLKIPAAKVFTLILYISSENFIIVLVPFLQSYQFGCHDTLLGLGNQIPK